MKINKKPILILAFFLLALFLRLYKLNTIPADLMTTEAVLGYSGYSLENNWHGIDHRLLPLAYQLNGKDILLGYSYLLIPLISRLGINNFIIRLPSAIFGSLTILLVFLLTQEIFKERKKEKFKIIPWLTALLMIFSPWHLQFSRRALPESVSLFFFCTSLYFLFRKTNQGKKINLILSFLFLFLSLLNKFRITDILLYFIIMIVLHIKINKNRLTYLFSAGVIFLSILFLKSDYQENLYRFLSLLSPDFLFFAGDPYTGEIINTGVLLFISLPFFLMGAIKIFENLTDRRFFLILVWLVMAFSPSFLDRANFNSQESLLGIIPLLIIVSLGIFVFYNYLNKKKLFWRNFFSLLFLGSFIYNLIFYFHFYYVHYLKFTQGKFIYAYKEVFDFVKKNSNEYDQIFITNKYEEPGISALFYLKYDPRKFLDAKESTERFGNLHFTNFSGWLAENGEKILYIAPADQQDIKGVKLREFTINIGKIFVAWRIIPDN